MLPNILILTYWSYKDALIQTYTLPYVRLIRKVLPIDSKIYLLTLEQPRSKLSASEQEEAQASLHREGIEWIRLNYAPFGFTMILRWLLGMFRLFVLILSKGISHIHVWCTPPGAIGYFLSLLTGRPLIIDSYEPHAEASLENGDWTANSWAFKILFTLEKWQSQRGKKLSLPTPKRWNNMPCKNTMQLLIGIIPSLLVSTWKSLIVKALKDPALLQELGLSDKLVAVYAGKIGGIYLDREIFDLLKAAQDHWGDSFRVLLLTNSPRDEIDKLALASGVDPGIIINAFVPHNEIHRYIGLGDFAINPVKPVPSKRYCTSVKDGEYWALGLPVIIPPNISDDSDIILENKAGAVLEAFTPEAYKKAVQEMADLLQQSSREDRYKKIRQLAKQYREL